jgi:hypothetical protein
MTGPKTWTYFNATLFHNGKTCLSTRRFIFLRLCVHGRRKESWEGMTYSLARSRTSRTWILKGGAYNWISGWSLLVARLYQRGKYRPTQTLNKTSWRCTETLKGRFTYITPRYVCGGIAQAWRWQCSGSDWHWQARKIAKSNAKRKPNIKNQRLGYELEILKYNFYKNRTGGDINYVIIDQSFLKNDKG